MDDEVVSGDKEKTTEEMAEFCGGAMMTKGEAAIIIQSELTGDILTAYTRGRLRAICETNESIRIMALRGSSPAQKQFHALIADSQERNDCGL